MTREGKTMSPDYVVELMKGLMAHIMMLATPLLLMGMTVGLMVSLFQAVTSLQGANPHLRAQGVSGECAAVFHHAVDGAYADGLHQGYLRENSSMVM